MMNGPTDRSSAAEAAVWDALRTVVEPELRASLVDLGMVRAVRVAGTAATVELALTMPGCPLAEWLEDQVRSAVLQLPGIQAVDVRIVDSPWPSFPTAPWRRWLDQALTPNHGERRRGEPEPGIPPQRSHSRRHLVLPRGFADGLVVDLCASAHPRLSRFPHRGTIERGFL